MPSEKVVTNAGSPRPALSRTLPALARTRLKVGTAAVPVPSSAATRMAGGDGSATTAVVGAASRSVLQRDAARRGWSASRGRFREEGAAVEAIMAEHQSNPIASSFATLVAEIGYMRFPFLVCL